MKNVRRIFAAAVSTLLVAGAQAQTPAPALSSASSTPDAANYVEKMLDALGGRAAWARLTSLTNDSLQYRLTEPTVVRTVISLDLTQPRWRIETTAPDLKLVRVVDGERDWRLNRAGQIESLPPAIRVEDVAWYGGHVYRTLHRLAKRDATLASAMQGDRLEVFEAGKRIFWVKTNVRGEPHLYGAHADEIGSLAGAWTVEHNGIRHPRWTARADGSWHSALQSFTVNDPYPIATFSRPKNARKDGISKSLFSPPLLIFLA